MAAAPARTRELTAEAAYRERVGAVASGRPRVAVVEPPARLTPLQRLHELFDEGSFQPLRTGVRSRRMGERARDGDGVIAGHGRVAGRPVCCYAQDGSFAGGSLGESHAESIVETLRLAGRAKVPVVGFIESAGARMQEGLAALSGYGRIFREHVALSGRVPQISVLCGPSAGGACYGPALTDFVIMSAEAAMFLTGPSVISEVTGEQIDIRTLGGPRVHERNGVCHLTASGDGDAARLARELLAHLPQHRDERRERVTPVGPAPIQIERIVPESQRAVYDMREVLRALLDGGACLEISPRFARNVVCALGRVDGRSVGVVANQPRYLGGVLDVASSQKAARFVRTCNAFGLPLLVLVDTPGFLPGSKQERDGVIRHGAKLVHAFAEASVPSVTVVLRKAFGGAFIAMNSKALGADRVYAWSGAELGVMGASQAVGILNRREIAAAADPTAARDVFAASYAAEHLHVGGASSDGFVDEVIEPRQTRQRVAGAFELLAHCGQDALPTGNIPL
ncbi:MAG: acyl-CoA carboxylase subunit beta [Solirubrobacteraceae bacterium]